MSSSSIISAIKSAILTETQSSVKIHERSLWSVIIEYNRNGWHNSWKDFGIKSYKGKSMMLTRHLFHFVYLIFLGLIFLLYFIFNCLRILFTGKWKNMNKSSSGINIILVSSVLITAIIMIVFILTFFIKDVVFHPNRAYINRKGVVTVEQPCYETQSFFLLNSATAWTSTGIQISKGDVVYITASGSMYSDIDDLYFNCKKNHKTNFDRVLYNAHSFPSRDKSKCFMGNNLRGISNDKNKAANENGVDPETVYCMYGRKKSDKDAFFGSLLYQIHPECQDGVVYNKSQDSIGFEPDCFEQVVGNVKSPLKLAIDCFGILNDIKSKDAIKQIVFDQPINEKLFKDNRFHFSADKSGVLFLSFNDIYLDTVICKRINNEEHSAYQSISYKKLFKNENNTAKVIFKKGNDNECIPVLDNEKKEELNEEIWFNDNLGEILVNVRTEKNLDNVKWYKRCFAYLYRNMNHIVQREFMSTHLPIFLFILIVYLMIEVVVSDYYMQKFIPKLIKKVINKVFLFIKRILHKKIINLN